MSADNVTTCPECLKEELREYRDAFGIKPGAMIGMYKLVIAYRCECRACGFTWEHDAIRVVPSKRIGAV